MRSAWWLVVVIAGVALFYMLRVSVSTAEQRRRAIVAAEIKEKTPNEVDGYGETEQAARANALRKAQGMVEKLLREQVNLPWVIPSGQLAPSYLEHYGVIHEIDKPAPDPKADNALRARYNVLLTDEYVAAVCKQARQESIAQEKLERQDSVVWRQQFLARIVGGMVVLLLVATGYLRLEEATRGYYTQILRLTAVVLVALAGVGLWLSL